MNAETVYQVAKALPKEEQQLLYDKLKEEFSVVAIYRKNKFKNVLTREDAVAYLLKNVFCNSKTTNNTKKSTIKR